MGQSKQLLIVDSKPLLRKITEEALTVKQSKVVVVLGAKSMEHEKVIHDLPVDIVVNEHWQNGMGSSLKAGLKFMETAIPESQAVIVLVCDQPFLTSYHLKKLIEKYYSSNKSIIASKYSNTLGVPCLFRKNYFSELMNLKDDQGAKKLIQLFKEDVESIEFPKGEVDLDTPDDYEKLGG
jgi:molybdenum cofactor cytidylyltransferase